MIDKIEREHVYFISLNVTICTESNKPCEQKFVVLRNALFPILQCSTDLTFIVESMYKLHIHFKVTFKQYLPLYVKSYFESLMMRRRQPD